MKIKITALDTLFFRDGKPFDMGEETWAVGQFPPLPSVFYGALRSLYFSIFPNDFATLHHGHDATKDLVINEISFWQSGDPMYPCPGDVVEIKEDESITLLQLENASGISSYPLKCMATSTEQVETLISTAVIRESAFKDDYLTGQLPSESAIEKIEKLMTFEPKVGIGRNNLTHTTDEGKLFRVGMSRLQNREGTPIEFFVDFDGLLDFKDKLPKKGFLKFGAENKTVAYEVLENYNAFERDTKLLSDYFKLTLTTPGIFENGWFPDFIDKDSHIGKFVNNDKTRVKLIGATIGKYLSIGGFDMKERRPKPMFKAVPAGSTYFFKILNGGIIDMDGKPTKIPCINNMENQGFGVAYIGTLASQKQPLK